MTLSEFTTWANGQSLPKYNDGQFRGECVSLINQYAWRVLNVPADAWGNAKDWAYNATALRYFTKLPASTPLNRGDVLVYPATPTNPDGHIEIYLGDGQSLQQNRKLDRKTSVLPIWGGYSAVLRPNNNKKEVVLNDQAIMWAYIAAYGTDPLPSDFEFWRGKPPENLLKALAEGNQDLRWKAGQFDTLKSQVATVAKENTDLKAKLALQGDDSINLTALGTALQWFVKRVGLK